MDRLALLASGNENKLRELRHALPGWRLELLAAVDYPPEEGDTYYENARTKAAYGHSLAPGDWVLGEDSGIEIEALGGGPGVRSSRWAAGREAEKAVEELRGIEGEGRQARYVCELVAIAPDGSEHRGTGILEGRIAEEPSGSAGFGFDPVFIPEGEEKTVAELGNDWKADHSHRARAAKALLDATHLQRLSNSLLQRRTGPLKAMPRGTCPGPVAVGRVSDGQPLSADHRRRPPEPGFARREAHYAQLNHHSGDRPTTHNSQATGRKEGVHGGTRGSPVKRARATRVRVLLRSRPRPPAGGPG